MKKLALATLSVTSLFSDVYYNAIVDWYFSPYSGADDILSAHRGLVYTQDWLAPPPDVPKRSFWAGMERFSELFFIWDPINSMASTTQHEVFGHGYQIRTHPHAMKVKGYKIGVPFPYGLGGGATKFTFDPHKLTVFEDLAVISGGVEGTAILANRLKLQWLQRGNIDARESSLYTGSEQDISQYIWITGNHKLDGEGDISYYVRHLNRTYPHGHLTISSLKKQALVNLLDPFTFYALYAWWHFVVSGKPTGIPMIHIGSYKYIPSARLGLTPFGPEFYLDNFLVKDNKPIYFYLRGGNFSKQTYLGFGIEHAYIWNLESLPWGLRLDCWYQPHTAFSNRKYSMHNLHEEGHFTHQPHNPHLGVSLTVIGHKKLWSNGAFFFQVGGKTIGYLEGEALQPSVIARVGLTIW
jgi:hypothetical protein